MNQFILKAFLGNVAYFGNPVHCAACVMRTESDAPLRRFWRRLFENVNFFSRDSARMVMIEAIAK